MKLRWIALSMFIAVGMTIASLTYIVVYGERPAWDSIGLAIAWVLLVRYSLKLREHAHKLEATMSECAEDLGGYLLQEYNGTQHTYPDQKRRYERDMGPVRAARDLKGKL